MKDFLDSLQDMKAKGHELIGCFPLYPPLELFHSFGLKPVVLWGLAQETAGYPKSDRHIQPYACRVARCLAEFVLTHGPGLMDALFMYNACDTLRNLPEIMDSALKDDGKPLPVFRLHVPAVPLGQPYADTYLKGRVESLVKDLEGFTGKPFSPDAFVSGIELYRRQRSLCMELENLAALGRASFAGCVPVLMAANRLPVEDHIALLEKSIREAAGNSGESSGAARVMISGILPPPASLLEAMEDAGLTVAANDIAALKRFYAATPAASPDPAAYYEDFYRNHHPCTTLLPSADSRIGLIRKTVQEKGIRGFIFIGEKFCEYEYFEAPHIEQMLKSEGLQFLFLEMSGDDDGQTGGIRTRIEAFAEMLAS